jgi:hypothetical protein
MTTFGLLSAAYDVTVGQHQNNDAADLFSAAFAAGRARRLMAAITRRPNTLRSLGADHVKGGGAHYAGLKPVALDDIRGSEGRQEDFDDRFNPLSARTRQRWESVAGALAEGIGLPPVELTQIENSYYVRDGHHRVSVMRAMGEQEIEARVTVWNAA